MYTHLSCDFCKQVTLYSYIELDTYIVDRALLAKYMVLTQDGNIITSSGVSAGMDMVMFFIDKIAGADVANQVAAYTEYDGQWTNPGADKWA